MKKKSVTIPVSPEKGSVSAEYFIPEKAICIMTLAHGAGAGMDHNFMVSLATRLADLGIATLRFNFPFMEGRKGPPDKPAVAQQTIAAAIDHAAASFPDLPLYVSGKSFGGRMSSQYMAEHHRAGVHGLVFYGFPLHPSGKPGIERAAHLADVRVKMLFLQGTKDDLAEWGLISSVCDSLSLATLVKIEGANHMFKAGKTDVISLLAQATRDWV